MSKSELRLIKSVREYCSKEEIREIPHGTRGIYVLYKRRGRVRASAHHYDFVYIGMARTNIRRRVKRHEKLKGELWSHFSHFEVWDNIGDDEIAELEGLFRHLYQYDSTANQLNKQKGYAPLTRLRKRTGSDLRRS